MEHSNCVTLTHPLAPSSSLTIIFHLTLDSYDIIL